jgi:hypothetical protein
MKSIVQNAKSILGIELVTSLQETYGANEKEFKEIIEEAIRALKIVQSDEDWQTVVVDDDYELN